MAILYLKRAKALMPFSARGKSCGLSHNDKNSCAHLFLVEKIAQAKYVYLCRLIRVNRKLQMDVCHGYCRESINLLSTSQEREINTTERNKK